MASDDKTPHFPLLNNTNYSEWSIHMEAELIRKGLWELVLCKVEKSGKDASEITAEIEKVKAKRSAKKMAEACAKIILRVEGLQLAHMRNWDPMAIWEALAQVHRVRGLAMRLALWQKFLMTVKGSAETMSAWVGCVKSMSFMLEDIGVMVTDEDRILALTMGLNTMYDSFVISLDSTPTTDLTLNYVVHHMLNEEVHRDNCMKEGVAHKKVTEGRNLESVAMTAMIGACTCCHCGKVGHVRAFCKEKPLHGKDRANTVADNDMAAW
jgi:hypothetical protein